MINVYKSILFSSVLAVFQVSFSEMHERFTVSTIYSIFTMRLMFVNELSSLPCTAIIIEKGDKHLFKTDTNLFATLKFQLFPFLFFALPLSSYRIKRHSFTCAFSSPLLSLVCFCDWDEPLTHASLPAFKTHTQRIGRIRMMQQRWARTLSTALIISVHFQ